MELHSSLSVLGVMCLLMLGLASADRLQGIEKKLQQMGHQFETLQGENLHLRRKLNGLQETTTQQQETIGKLDDTITKLQNTDANMASVAFRAMRTSDLGPVSQDTNIVYNAVGFNIGGGYEQSTGAFTAPIAGTYIFTNLHRLEGAVIYVYENGALRILSVGGAESSHVADPTMSSSVVLNLAVDDTVTVKLSGSSGIRKIKCASSGGECVFSGALIPSSAGNITVNANKFRKP